MKRKPDRKSALRKPHAKMTRRILVGADERERRSLLDQVKAMARRGTGDVLETALSLRRNHGISLPTLSPEWDLVPTNATTPLRTILAFEGTTSEVRVTLHLDTLTDDTTPARLENLGISHLIGITIIEPNEPRWQSHESGGMIAEVESPIERLPSLLHDLLLDMAMIHAKAQSWSGIRRNLSSAVIANYKSEFVEERDLIGVFPYGALGKNRYFPLAAFARTRRNEQDSSDLIDLQSYVELWSQFASFVKQRANIPLLAGKEHVGKRLVESHLNGGQLSLAKLNRKIAGLGPGHYCLYLLIRKARPRAKISELSTFFRVSTDHLRTQLIVIHPREKYAKQASIFLNERYISVYPFYVGEE